MAAAKSTKAPAFQFYARDYLADQEQALMSLAEAGAYIRLLAHCWLSGSLPSSTVALARLCGATPGQMTKFWPAISKCFKQNADGRWTHHRLDKERRKQADFSKKQKEKADRLWQRRKDAAASPRQSTGNALQSASASSSASTSSEERRGRTPSPPRGAPLVAKRKPWAAFEGSRSLDVPQGTHERFRALLNRPDAEAVLFAWYRDVCEEWTTGARREDQPGEDLPSFWRARFREKWPATATDKKDIPIGQRWRPEHDTGRVS